MEQAARRGIMPALRAARLHFLGQAFLYLQLVAGAALAERAWLVLALVGQAARAERQLEGT